MAMTNKLGLSHSPSGSADGRDFHLHVQALRKSLLAEHEVFCQNLKEKINRYDLQIALNRREKDSLHAAIVQWYEVVGHDVQAKEQSDRRGMGKFNSRLSAFAKSAMDFFTNYSGLSEIARGIDNNFGPIAYGTFSLFLTVAQSKEIHRALTHSILEELGKWLPRLETIRAIEKDNPTLMKSVLEIYIEMVHFFQYMTEFLCSTRASRMYKLISQPPQQVLQARLDIIKEKYKNLLEDLNFRLYERFDEVTVSLNRLEGMGKESADYTKKKAADDHHDRMSRIAKALGLPSDFGAHVVSMISHCDSAVYQAPFGFRKKAASRPMRLQQISLEALGQNPQFKAWLNAEQSSLLLLGGENMNTDVFQSWLSPVTPKFFAFAQTLPNCNVVFHSINATMAGGHYQSPEHQILRTVKSILYQVLCQEPRLCQSQEKDILEGWYPDTDLIDDDPIEAEIQHWVNVLSVVLSSAYLEIKKVFVILDGVERLSAPAPRTLFKHVLQLLDETQDESTIKVLSICSALNLDRVKGSNDDTGLRYALGQGAETKMMARVFADLFWKQTVLAGSN